MFDLQQLWILLQLPFVYRAIIAGLILAVASGVMGVFTTLRRSAFFGDALAHAALAGVALAFLVAAPPLPVAFVYSLLLVLLIQFLQRSTQFDLDTVLGIMLPTSMGLGVLIFALLPGYQPQLMSYLFGSMLTIGWSEIIFLGGVTVALLIAFSFLYRHVVLMTLDEQYSRLLGIPTRFIDAGYHIFLALLVLLGVQLVGVILINALLVVPASIARLLARSMRQLFMLSIITAVIIVVIGLLLALFFDLPPGAVIAVVAGIAFLLTTLLREFARSL